MTKRLIALDYDAIRTAFNAEFKSTRKLIESGETHLDNLAEGFTEADRVLYRMSTVDAVEVVRCSECKLWEPHCNGKAGVCPKRRGVAKADDFCSYGERKE